MYYCDSVIGWHRTSATDSLSYKVSLHNPRELLLSGTSTMAGVQRGVGWTVTQLFPVLAAKIMLLKEYFNWVKFSQASDSLHQQPNISLYPLQ